jgi:hypothetical protein
MRFEEAHAGWQAGRLAQQEAARLLGVCERSFRRYVDRYEAGGLDRLMDKRMSQLSHRRAPLPGMMLHQDGSTHEWVPGVRWDLIVTMDDATGEHLSMFFVHQEGTASSFNGLGQTIAARGLFAMLYTDRGSHYFVTPEAGGKVDKGQLTQVGRALAQLSIHHQGAYCPEARGRSERAFGTHRQRLPRELALAGITDMAQASRYLEQVYRPAYNAEFAVPAAEPGSAFVPYIGPSLTSCASSSSAPWARTTA